MRSNNMFQLKEISKQSMLFSSQNALMASAQSDEFSFSINLLLNCLERVFDRKNHPTLQGDELRLTRIILSFFGAQKNFKFRDSKDLQVYNLDYFWEFPFHVDEESSKIDSDLVQKIEKIAELLS